MNDELFTQQVSRHYGCMNVIAVYNNPADYPDKYVARLWFVGAPTLTYVVKDTLAEIHEIIPQFYIKFDTRGKEKDPKICEEWVW